MNFDSSLRSAKDVVLFAITKDHRGAEEDLYEQVQTLPRPLPRELRAQSPLSQREYKRLASIKQEIDPTGIYTGGSVSILRVFDTIAEFNTPPVDQKPVLIYGPSGSGKSHLARLVHESSLRKKNAFRVEHSATMKGADWGIVLARWAGHGVRSGLKDVPPEGTEGLLQECAGGSVFIDEVADLSMDAQTLLLQVLDRQPVSKAAGSGPQVVPDVRLIFATNKDLSRLVKSGEFRHDLLLRIEANTITIPPLHERRDDIPLFVQKRCSGHKRSPRFLLALLLHDWPDEVRGLLAALDRAMTENHWDQMYAETIEEALDHADPGAMPSHLLTVPGFIDEVIDYTLSTAPYPQPVLAFGGALALQAVLAGRKVRDESDNRTNLYMLGLANSGAGKDYPRKVNQQILMHAGLQDSIGDTFASGEGIEDRLFSNPCVLFQTDEIDGLMTKINQAKDARHEAIVNILLKMYSSANSFYPMRVKAGKEPCVIDQPCLCIFGTAIPRNYYQALSEKMLSNGFFARMLILEAQKRGRGQEAVVRAIPESILETARWWVEFRPGGHGNLDQLHPTPQTVRATPDAIEVLRQLRERSDDEYSRAEDRDDAMAMAIWARAHEKARRLALIYACSENHEEPLIGEAAALWASEFVDHQTRRMLFMASGHVSENEFDARCKAIVATLRKWRDKHGDAWMPFWKVNRKHKWTDKEHDEIRTSLLNQRILDFKQVSTGGRPGKHYRLLETS